MPAATPRGRTLLGLVGLSPAVIPETLYALSLESPPTRISRLVLVTTHRALPTLERDLLGRLGGLVRLLERFPKIHPRLDPARTRLEILKGADGLPLPDIVTPEDSTAVGFVRTVSLYVPNSGRDRKTGYGFRLNPTIVHRAVTVLRRLRVGIGHLVTILSPWRSLSPGVKCRERPGENAVRNRSPSGGDRRLETGQPSHRRPSYGTCR